MKHICESCESQVNVNDNYCPSCGSMFDAFSSKKIDGLIKTLGKLSEVSVEVSSSPYSVTIEWEGEDQYYEVSIEKEGKFYQVDAEFNAPDSMLEDGEWVGKKTEKELIKLLTELISETKTIIEDSCGLGHGNKKDVKRMAKQTRRAENEESLKRMLKKPKKSKKKRY